MKLSREITEIQKKLSKVNADFLTFVEDHPETLKSANYKLLELNDDLFRLQPWPTFINREAKEVFREAGVNLFNLIKKIPKRLFDNDPQKISDYYKLPINLVKLQMEGVTDDHIDTLISRGDFILSPTGLKCLEFNVTANLGGWQIPIWEVLYLNTPIISKFFKEYQVKTFNENLLYIFLEHCIYCRLVNTPGQAEINMALVVKGFAQGGENSTVTYLTNLYQDALHSIARALKGEFFVCDYQHLAFKDNRIFYKDREIHVIAEHYNGLVSPEILKAFTAGNIRLLNGPITDLLSNKLNLALLSDYETSGVFTGEEKEIIEKYVPWSRKIAPCCTTYRGEKIDLEHFIRANREKLVIKPSLGYGGFGVYIGKRSTEKEWEKLVQNAIEEKNWLVQELVEASVGLYQCGEDGYDYHDMVWGFFVFGSRYSGAWVRVMPNKYNWGIINCHQGASVSGIFEVDE